MTPDADGLPPDAEQCHEGGKPDVRDGHADLPLRTSELQDRVHQCHSTDQQGWRTQSLQGEADDGVSPLDRCPLSCEGRHIRAHDIIDRMTIVNSLDQVGPVLAAKDRTVVPPRQTSRSTRLACLSPCRKQQSQSIHPRAQRSECSTREQRRWNRPPEPTLRADYRRHLVLTKRDASVLNGGGA